MKTHRAWRLVLALAILAGRATPVPPEKLSYAGDQNVECW